MIVSLLETEDEREFAGDSSAQDFAANFDVRTEMENTECRASGSTCSHLETGRFADSRASRAAFQMIPLCRSTWPLPMGVVGCGFT